ncbi:rho GDP-dissociation inhibitor [Streptomyces sp. NBC_00322]|uniref:hypothetical protein n=1 Tax=Streptomyces sp. NBC_00322 TaxID=2975712 RepID=UPI002E284840|nr:hypothetical protein [Streptomyces sp. NBC_00322]
MNTPLEHPTGDTREFELLHVTLQAEGHDDLVVALPTSDESEASPQPAPFSLREGAEIRITLVFRVGRAVERLKFVDERKRQGAVVGKTEVMLGSFRPGGPYELVLPLERLPIGHLARDTYEVTGTFVDADDNVLGYETHRFEITKD